MQGRTSSSAPKRAPVLAGPSERGDRARELDRAAGGHDDRRPEVTMPVQGLDRGQRQEELPSAFATAGCLAEGSVGHREPTRARRSVAASPDDPIAARRNPQRAMLVVAKVDTRCPQVQEADPAAGLVLLERTVTAGRADSVRASPVRSPCATTTHGSPDASPWHRRCARRIAAAGRSRTIALARSASSAPIPARSRRHHRQSRTKRHSLTLRVGTPWTARGPAGRARG